MLQHQECKHNLQLRPRNEGSTTMFGDEKSRAYALVAPNNPGAEVYGRRGRCVFGTSALQYRKTFLVALITKEELTSNISNCSDTR